MKRSLSLTATAVTAAGLIALGATSAAAHVTVDASTTEGGSYAILTVAVPHGCGNSATTGISIQVPEEFSSVTPTVHPSWDVEVVMETLDSPIDDGHGGELTERVGEVLYEAHDPLPADQRDAFELSVRLPDSPGETIAFPVVQTCEEGEAAWVQLPADGQDAGDLEMPAPFLTVTAAGSEGDSAAGTEHADAEHGAGSDSAEPGAAEAEPADDSEAGEDGTGVEADAGAAAEPVAGSDAGNAGAGAEADAGTTEESAATAGSGAPAVVAWIALALGAGGLLLGGLAFARTRTS